MQKPITILRKEFTENIVEDVNSSGLPLLIIEPILQNLLESVRQSIKIQEEKDLAEYMESLQKEAQNAEAVNAENNVPSETEG